MAVSLLHFRAPVGSSGTMPWAHPDGRGLRSTSRHCFMLICQRTVVSDAADGYFNSSTRPTPPWHTLPSCTAGDCIRIFRGNSNCDPIISLSFRDHNSICVNTSTTMHVLYFDTGEQPCCNAGSPDVASLYQEPWIMCDHVWAAQVGTVMLRHTTTRLSPSGLVPYPHRIPLRFLPRSDPHARVSTKAHRSRCAGERYRCERGAVRGVPIQEQSCIW